MKELTQYNQWVCWKKDSKRGKVPYDPKTGKMASVADSETWSDYATAYANKDKYNGLGFVFTDNDPFCCIDLDNIVGNTPKEAQDIIDTFKTYGEYSQSKKGMHIIFKGAKPGSRCRKKELPWFEVYDRCRFIAITCLKSNTDYHITECQSELDALYNKIFPPTPKQELKPFEKLCDISDIEDSKLIELAMNSKNGSKFTELFSGGDVHNDNSANDLALMDLLAFWTGKDPARMESLFNMSGLGKRDKWIKREDYRRRTIQKAIDECEEVFAPKETDFKKLSEEFFGDVEKLSPPLIPPDAVGGRPEDELPTDGAEGEQEGEEWTVPFILEDFSDLGNAKFFYRKHPSDFLYTNENWYWWNGMKWQVVDDTFMKQQVQEIPGTLKKLFDNLAEPKLKKEALKWARTSGGSSHLSAIVTECKAMYSQQVEFDKDPHLINCLQGIINLRTLEILPHDRKYYCSKIVNCKLSDEIPQEFLIFLSRALYNDQELERYLQKVLGYCLTGENSEQSAYFLCGQGQTGKSTLLTLIGKIMGEYSYNAPSGMFMDSLSGSSKFDLVNLHNKRLCCTNELSSAKSLASEVFKKVTGGDTQDCDRKFKTPLRVRFYAKVLVATNELPTFNPDYAIKRRLKFIKFDRKVENPSDSINQKLWKERDSIFAWLVQGAYLYYKEGVGELDSMKKFKEESIKENNPMLVWFTDTYDVLDSNEEGYVSISDLWNAWCQYCLENHLTNPYKSNVWFVRTIRQQFPSIKPVRIKNNTERGLKGIRIKF